MTRTFTIPTLAAMLVLVACGDRPAGTPTANTPAATPDPLQADPSAQPAATPPSQADAATQAFLDQLMSTNELAVRSSQIAMERSQDEDTRRFAQRMIADHQAATQRLGNLVGNVRLTPSGGASLTDRHVGLLADLEQADGGDFDLAYRRLQLNLHQEAIALVTDYRQGGTHDDLRAFAGELLPQFEGHLDDVPSPRAVRPD